MNYDPLALSVAFWLLISCIPVCLGIVIFELTRDFP